MVLKNLKKALKGSGLIVLDWNNNRYYTITKRGFQGGGSCPELARVDKETGDVSYITDAEGRYEILYTLQNLL
jgi:hypothetical protein